MSEIREVCMQQRRGPEFLDLKPGKLIPFLSLSPAASWIRNFALQLTNHRSVWL